MQPQAALIRPDRAVELYAVTAVDLRFSLIIHPGNAEQDGAFWLYEAFQQACLLVFRVLFKHGREAGEDFGCGLEKLGFVWVACLQPIQHADGIVVHGKSNPFQYD